MSTTKSEYVVMSEAGKEMKWLKNFLDEMDMKQQQRVLHSDSQSAVQLANYHYTRSLVDDGVLVLRKIVGSKNLADMLTKVVPSEKLRLCRTSIGLPF